MSYNSGSIRARNFKSASRYALVRFWNYSPDYSLNCTTRSPITIIYYYYWLVTDSSNPNWKLTIVNKWLALMHKTDVWPVLGLKLFDSMLTLLETPIPRLKMRITHYIEVKLDLTWHRISLATYKSSLHCYDLLTVSPVKNTGSHSL